MVEKIKENFKAFTIEAVKVSTDKEVKKLKDEVWSPRILDKITENQYQEISKKDEKLLKKLNISIEKWIDKNWNEFLKLTSSWDKFFNYGYQFKFNTEYFDKEKLYLKDEELNNYSLWKFTYITSVYDSKIDIDDKEDQYWRYKITKFDSNWKIEGYEYIESNETRLRQIVAFEKALNNKEDIKNMIKNNDIGFFGFLTTNYRNTINLKNNNNFKSAIKELFEEKWYNIKYDDISPDVHDIWFWKFGENDYAIQVKDWNKLYFLLPWWEIKQIEYLENTYRNKLRKQRETKWGVSFK